MDYSNKEAIKSSMVKQREIDMNIALKKLDDVPMYNNNENKEHYFQMFYAHLCNIRLGFFESFNKPTTIQGFKGEYEHDFKNLIEIWDIQREVDKEYRDIFDSKAREIIELKVS